MNRAIVLQAQSIDALTQVDRAMPKPGRGQVVVRMRAASLNSRDLQIANGWYVLVPSFPHVPLSDGAGDVVEVGEGVDRVRVGDRVAATFWQRWDGGGPELLDPASSLGTPLDGVLQEYRVLDQTGVVHLPDSLSYIEAATLPCAAVTAWSSLVTWGKLKAGDTVLVQGTGGVAIFALQFATMFGARVIVTSRSDEKLERARSLGASMTVNYARTSDWDRAVIEATDGRGVDHVIEIGGPGTIERSVQSTAPGGTVNVIGYLDGNESGLSARTILSRRATIRGIPVGPRESFEQLLKALDASGVRPVIDRVFAFDEAREAYRYLASGAHFGKIALSIS